MAAAEARAVWQRAANRCFVQEDAKRAPKLACCQSSSSTSKQVEAGPTTAAYGSDYPSSGFRPFSRNSSYSNLSLDTRWWLQMQPRFGYQKVFTYEELNALESDETLRTGIEDPISEISEVRSQTGESTGVDGQDNSDSCLDVDHGADVCLKKAPEVKFLHGKNMEELENATESCENVKLDSKNCPKTKQPNEFCIGPECNWMGNEKTEPWWRMTDRDELVSLVARKSLDHIENCDLPPPQKMCHRRHPYAHIGYLDQKENLVSSLDRLAPTDGLSNRTVYTEGFANTRRKHEIQEFLTEKDLNNYGSSKPFSSPTATLQSNSTEAQLDPAEGELSKAQLIEALCHSQTRAREAEKAAKKAYADKEHVVSLFFKQASHLFAYKQWFRLLQLETLYVQLKNNDQQIATIVPLVLPWMSYKGLKRKPRKSWRKGAKSKRCKLDRPCHDITKYAVALALGLSLVGAGLFLGWTVGWMLPSF